MTMVALIVFFLLLVFSVTILCTGFYVNALDKETKICQIAAVKRKYQFVCD